MNPQRDDPLLVSSKREAWFAAALWLVATVYSIGYCARFGYNREGADLTFVLGVPDWVFWGILAPWVACTAISCWFALFVMRDDPLGDVAAVDPAARDAAEMLDAEIHGEERRNG